MRVAGVDGCRSGWVVATVSTGGRHRPVVETVEVLDHAKTIIERLDTGALAFVAIDIPVGLPADGPRPCDIEARRLLGPRRSSVFPAPARAVLGADDYADALVRSRAATGKGLSKQTFNLLGKIGEIDTVWRPDLGDRLVESHPELAFSRLAAGRPLATRKHDPAGRAERLGLLTAALDLGTGACPRPAGAGADDVLDALALSVTARHLAAGTAEILGGARDQAARPMQIAF
jgi:predicted RNase H-like nuclease